MKYYDLHIEIENDAKKVIEYAIADKNNLINMTLIQIVICFVIQLLNLIMRRV